MNKKGVIHADIKPKNIVLTEPHIKLIDLGNSNWVSHKLEAYTPGFAAPEMDRGIRDNRTDVYALASTTFSLLFGKEPPYYAWMLSSEAFDSTEFIYGMEKYGLTQQDKLNLKNVLVKGFSENPDDRYQTSSEFADAFCKIFSKPSTPKS